MGTADDWVRWFEELGAGDVRVAGGKNASLGEMIRALEPAGVRVPGGFATTAAAYRRFVESNGLADPVREHLERLARGEESLKEAGRAIRERFLGARFPDPVADAIRRAYRELGKRYGVEDPDVAVRSSATAEDLPEASFAGQQETYLNVRGQEDLLEACRSCYAPSDRPEFAGFLVEAGIDSISVNPDRVLDVIRRVAKAEARKAG